jgi:putative ABC transport system substrate-binding protein
VAVIATRDGRGPLERSLYVQELGVIPTVAWLATSLLVLVMALTAAAQQHEGKLPRIGVLVFTSLTTAQQAQFRQALRDYGYIEGQNVLVEWRAAEGRPDRAKALADDLIALKVDVIVAMTTGAVQAAKNATSTIPIVMMAGEPVGSGLVASLARPGSNITGVSQIAAELSAKRIELLRELIPGLTRVAVLINETSPFARPLLEETRTATRRAGIQLQVLDVRRAAEVEAAFSMVVKERAAAVIVASALAAPAWRTAELALRHHLPSVYFQRQFAEAGGLMSFGPHFADMHRRTASYVDRILKGAKPADLPVEQPTRLELVINLRTAKALGLKIPQSLLLRADHVVE